MAPPWPDRRLPGAIALFLSLLAACDDGASAGAPDAGSTLTSQEGHACSINPADDPLLVCSVPQQLVCVSTFSVQSFDGGSREVFVCRFPCTGQDQCPQTGDVCCPALRGGGAATHACVPAARCQGADGGA
jgi:hypothetical protein